MGWKKIIDDAALNQELTKNEAAFFKQSTEPTNSDCQTLKARDLKDGDVWWDTSKTPMLKHLYDADALAWVAEYSTNPDNIGISDNGDGTYSVKVDGSGNDSIDVGAEIASSDVTDLSDSNGSLLKTYDTKTTLDADTSQSSGTVAKVTDDTTPENNGLYVYDGAV
jgi:hypothetical protein